MSALIDLRGQLFQRVSAIAPLGVKRRIRHQINRLGYFRERAVRGYRAKDGVRSEIFPGVDPDQVMGSLNRDGVWQGLKLPPKILAELVEYSMNTPVYGDRKPALGFLVKNRPEAEKRANKSLGLACHFNTYDDCPTVQRLATDPVIQEIAMRYVGPRCKCFGSTMWWNFPNPGVSLKEQDHYAQRFHYDLDALRFVKFFFYLTDVDLDSGPHVFVTRTHQRKRLRHLWPKRRLEDADVERSYGKDAVLFLQGKAGDGFIEDTFGLHKGLIPVSKPRLVLQLEYGIAGHENRVDASERAHLKRIDV